MEGSVVLGIRQLFRKFARRRPAGPSHVGISLNPAIHPVRASHGYAGHLVDSEGRDWIDLQCAWGANILGYGYPRVTEAIQRQAQRYAGLGMEGPEFDEFRELFRRIVPFAEAMRFGKNGSDVTSAAVRLARAITGRDRVLHCGYHSFHDWYVASTGCPGIPAALRRTITTLETLVPDVVEAHFQHDPRGIACLIFDTALLPNSDGTDVKAMVEIVRQRGALVIFDELVSGFRMAPGGMQEIWKIEPDLACYGKSAANGMPFTILAGNRKFMDAIPRINYGLTHETEAISVAAAIATISEILENNVCQALAEKGAALKDACLRAAGECGVAVALVGADARPLLACDHQSGLSADEMRWLVIQELARDNVLTLGAFNLCFSHTDQDIERIVESMSRGMGVLRAALDRRSVEGLLDSRIHSSIRT